jgi:hypothetical protein
MTSYILTVEKYMDTITIRLILLVCVTVLYINLMKFMVTRNSFYLPSTFQLGKFIGKNVWRNE